MPGHICNHSDHHGRYAYNRQPNIAYWNLFCLAQALLPLIEDQDTALAALESYKTVFPERLHGADAQKTGVDAGTDAQRSAGVEPLLQLLAQNAVDYTIFLAPPVPCRRPRGSLNPFVTCLPTERLSTPGCYHIQSYLRLRIKR